MVLCKERDGKPIVRHPQRNRTLRPRGHWAALGLSANRMGAISFANHSSSGKGSGPISRGWATDRLGILQGDTAHYWGPLEGQLFLRFSLQSLIAASQESSRWCYRCAEGSA